MPLYTLKKSKMLNFMLLVVDGTVKVFRIKLFGKRVCPFKRTLPNRRTNAKSARTLLRELLNFVWHRGWKTGTTTW